MLNRAALAACAALLFSPVAAAQMSGSYTIDPSGSGARNFKSFGAACKALEANGVSGAVVIDVKPVAHHESWTLNPVSGTSKSNTITFRGRVGKTRLTGPKNPMALFTRAHHVRFMRFDVSSTSTQGSFLLNVQSDSFELTDCKFTTSGRVWAVWLGGTDHSIHDNVFVGTGVSTSGWGRVYANRFTYVVGTYAAVQGSGAFYNNIIEGGANTTWVPVRLFSDNVDFWHNTISVQTARAAVELWFVTNSTRRSTIRNNIIDVRGTGVGIRAYTYSSNARLWSELNHNLYSVASGKLGEFRGTPYSSLPSWQGAISNWGTSRNGRNSRIGDPRFVSSTDFHLRAGSAALDGADVKPVSYIGTARVRGDRDGLLRGSLADIGAYELAGHEWAGAGCSGTNSLTPLLDLAGDIGPGKFARFEVTKARPGAAAFFAIGLDNTAIPLGGTCSLITRPLLTIPTFKTSSAGATSIQFNLPTNQPVNGLDAYAQFGIVDPRAAGIGVALTRGVRVRL